MRRWRTWTALAAESPGALMNSLALSGGTLVRLSLGFVTWLAAARLYPPAEVGLAAGAISAMTLCVQVGLLGIDVAAIALMPRYGREPAALINPAITLAMLVAGVVAIAFVGVAASGFRALDVLSSNALYAGVFILLTVLQAAWWLMDQVAVGLRRADDVLIRAVAAGGVTVGGVVALGVAGVDDAGAVLAAWLAAAAVASAMGLAHIARRVPRYRFRLRLPYDVGRRLLAVGIPNFALTTADNAPGLMLPIVAAEVLSPRQAAFWYAVWMMSLAAYTIPFAFALNLFAEISHAPSDLARHVAHALRSGAALAAAASLGLVVAGPLLLSFLGAEYADSGTTPLRLVALAAAPLVVLKVYLFTCRATGRIGEGTAVAVVVGIAAVATGVAAAASVGLAGMAGAWLAVQAIAAVAVGLRLRVLMFSAAREPQVPTTLVPGGGERIAGI